MTDLEFDIIDELYFVTAYEALKEATGLTDSELQQGLLDLVGKGWVRVYTSVDEASEMGVEELKDSFQSYFYLASKKGLFEHNSQ